MIERIRRRAADPETRTDVPTPGETSHFGGRFTTVVVALDGSDPTADELPDPVGAEEIAETEARLGVALPEDLVRILTEVADGGFGPGGGLPSLREMTSRYLDMITESPDWYGRPWPTNLFPIDLELPGADCIDLDSGQIVYWDEELASERPGDNGWTESFTVVAGSLEALLQAWLDSPSPREASAKARDEMLLDGLRRSLEYRRAMTPKERAEHGLPEVGWEQELFGHLGSTSTTCERRRPPDRLRRPSDRLLRSVHAALTGRRCDCRRDRTRGLEAGIRGTRTGAGGRYRCDRTACTYRY